MTSFLNLDEPSQLHDVLLSGKPLDVSWMTRRTDLCPFTIPEKAYLPLPFEYLRYGVDESGEEVEGIPSKPFEQLATDLPVQLQKVRSKIPMLCLL